MVDALVDLSWRAYPAGAIMALGLGVASYGAAGLRAWLRVSAFDDKKVLMFVGALRAVLVGLAIAGVGGAWIWQQIWILLISLAIGGEELLETSVVLFALRRGKRLQQQADTLTV